MQENENGKKVVGMRRFRDLLADINIEEEEKKGLGLFGDPQKPSTTGINGAVADEGPTTSTTRSAQFFRELNQSTTIFTFIVQFTSYLFSRMRFFVVILSVLAEFLGNFIETFKKRIVRHMFWTRGGAFKYAVQIVGVLVLMIVLLSGSYRSDVQGEGEAYSPPTVYAQSGESSANRYSDLLVQNASTNTLIPEDRRRIDVVEYVVRTGDTLSGIADFYGISMQTLQWANDLTEAHVIKPGEVLRIPPGNGVLKAVEEGDTIDTFASRWSGNAQSIADANWIDPPFTLTAGQVLFVPDGKIPAPVVVPTYYSGVVSSGSGWWSTGYVDPNVGQFLSWPVADCRGMISQWPSAWHNAIDISDGGMPDVVATAPGVVRFAGCHSGDCPAPGQMYGGSGAAWGIEIDHGNGYTSFYAHLNALYVTAGQAVYTGQPIGQMGASGSATGIHLHFELWQGQKWNRVTPTYYFPGGTCGKL